EAGCFRAVDDDARRAGGGDAGHERALVIAIALALTGRYPPEAEKEHERRLQHRPPEPAAPRLAGQTLPDGGPERTFGNWQAAGTGSRRGDPVVAPGDLPGRRDARR